VRPEVLTWTRRRQILLDEIKSLTSPTPPDIMCCEELNDYWVRALFAFASILPSYLFWFIRSRSGAVCEWEKGESARCVCGAPCGPHAPDLFECPKITALQKPSFVGVGENCIRIEFRLMRGSHTPDVLARRDARLWLRQRLREAAQPCLLVLGRMEQGRRYRQASAGFCSTFVSALLSRFASASCLAVGLL